MGAAESAIAARTLTRRFGERAFAQDRRTGAGEAGLKRETQLAGNGHLLLERDGRKAFQALARVPGLESTGPPQSASTVALADVSKYLDPVTVPVPPRKVSSIAMLQARA